MREFIRLQLKLKWGLNRNNDKKSALMTTAAAGLAIAVALVLALALTFVLKSSVKASPKRLATLYLTLIMAALTVVATGMQLARLYRPGDLAITARFPLGPFKVFASYVILNYIDLLIYSAMLVLPVMIPFGAVANCISAVYILGVFVGVFFMPIVPFALSVFLAMPITYAAHLLERHGVVRLCFFVVFLAGCFVLYNYLLTILANFFIHRNWEQGTLEIWEKLLASLDSVYNPAYYIGNIIFFETMKDFGLGFAVILGGGLVVGAIGIAIARAMYARIRTKALEGSYGPSTRRSAVDGLGTFPAMFRYGMREIMRTKTYSYFYLGVAISTPVMVFFCSRLVSMVGEAEIGSGINFGAAMLVISVFSAMICSFAGSTISVEGKYFYITKLVPVSYRKQLLTKGLLNVVVSMVALAISAVVMSALKFLSAAEMAAVVVTQTVLIAGLVFNGININLVSPNLKPKANGEAEEINITYMLIIGLVLAAGMGCVAIIFPRMWASGATWAYLTCAGAAIVYAAVNFAVFWLTANRKYSKIEA